MTVSLPANRFPSQKIVVGGMSKDELRSRLASAGVLLNEAGETLFADARFPVRSDVSQIEIVELPVADLDLNTGGVTARVYERAAELGLGLCPLELGPHFRLQYLDQPEGSIGNPPTRHRAPPGSLTVASAPLSDDDLVPKGFYLRRIDGQLWLRGYRCDSLHAWSPEDRLVFRLPD